MKQRPTLITRIYRLKLLLVGVLLLTLGLLTSMLSAWLEELATPHLMTALVSGLSDVLLVTGAIGIAVDFFTGRDREAADTERLRHVLKEAAPDIRDAVIAGFAETPEDLRGVATEETLDKLATNALALRLGDEQFASEIYTDVRDQAIRAPERWHDVEVNIRLSTAVETDTRGVRLFDVLVEWEYTTVPGHSVRRFACVSDRDEYDELVSDVPATSTWFMTPGPGMDAGDPGSFELLYFGVDGEERKIRRQQRKGSQTYTVTLSDATAQPGKPVHIRHLYRTRVTQTGHFLFIELPQPTRDLSLRMDYTDTDISRLTVMDLVTSNHRPKILEMPPQVDARSVSIDLRGWLLPRAGFTFVWSLVSEQTGPSADSSSEPTSRSASRGA